MKYSLYFVLLFIISCQGTSHLKSNEELVSLLEQKVINDDQSLELSDIDLFEWDSVMLFGPYSNLEFENSRLDVNLDNIEHNLIKDHDSFNLIVFLKEGKSVEIAELSREYGDFDIDLIEIDRSKAILYKKGKTFRLKD